MTVIQCYGIMDNALLWYVVLSLSLHTYNVKKLGKISTRGENVNGEKQNTSSEVG